MYLFFLERYPHGIFVAGGAYVPTQEKKKVYGQRHMFGMIATPREIFFTR